MTILQSKYWLIPYLAVWQNGHTLANLGWMYQYDFYSIFSKRHFEYILSNNVNDIGVTRFV